MGFAVFLQSSWEQSKQNTSGLAVAWVLRSRAYPQAANSPHAPFWSTTLQ